MNKLLRLAAFWIVQSFAQTGFAGPAPEPFFIYTYHDKPPYYTKAKKSDSGLSDKSLATGLYPSFVQLLDKHQERPLVLRYLPRRRLEQQLKGHLLDGAIIGVNPVWFKDKNRQHYLWSSSFLHDKDVIAVRQGASFAYAHPNDLTNRILAIPRGYYLWGITENIYNKRQKAILTSSELQSLKLIAAERAEATVISEKTLAYLTRNVFNQHTFEILPVAHDTFDRHLLFPKSLREDFELFESVIEKIAESPEWLQLVKDQAL